MTPTTQEPPVDGATGNGMIQRAIYRTGDEALDKIGTRGEGTPIKLSDRALARLYNTIRIVLWIIGISAIPTIGFLAYRLIVPVAKLEEKVVNVQESIGKIENRIERLENRIFLGEGIDKVPSESEDRQRTP
ncbi:hypothetical protein A3H22_03355 [Candidatus Peribacteria bacterium RIFCSPLOWO2_12_FULL_55_15]|nr:MAG: hypothetical protein A2789_02005 [Candidatus Peribacteria bacterium RIFCSPHIGHO2_01_FULL_54_22]OGJ63622.1 MAG: hypothetical protein A3D12_03375 [Candidatus Peribacteria bacterium RIFCSPHIGHO2_02_FULL_55_24]OGJ69072.1 MAG: hypothetical protein A2947_00370 [Candidatus Peribacteria bacterium RIFCSPLOWO2_01_FULL_54_110]OGJ69951.1 MAG: hypothetical protein A3H90_01015 [Candidatus Peribacteria bacterium RIFCSPLOWO2_02_FULL_55_36]OGJ72309.1 MAG: hypothetical protein A3H22_03355 [Candidatus Per